MKREVLFAFLIISLIFIISFAIADETDDKINNAYTCLTNKVQGKCSTLSLEEKIFSLLSIEQCQAEVLATSNNNQCWPSSNCNLKTTAQAVLALDNVGVDVTNASSWLLSQKTTPSTIDWYLEIESSQATTCTIVYDSNSYPITIDSDKKINANAGNCLSLSSAPYADYFLKISSSCYAKTFDVSCNESFLTTLLYKKTNSPILYVSDQAPSASAGGTTSSKVDFSCFKQGSTCDYQGSLWAAYVLNLLGEDVSLYKPYLVTMAEENQQYLPESFLYSIDSDTNFRSIVLSKQQSNKWWSDSGDKYHDTALALLPFQNENPTEKTNSKNWLLTAQDSEACWQGNIRNTAFILYSIWSEYFSGSSDSSCGNGAVNPGEDCDDGNNADGDGCSSTCDLENPDDCGNEAIDAGEECDDGNTNNNDGCSSTCQDEATCGDNVIEMNEECEGSDLNNQTCESIGFAEGNLSCYDVGTENECTFDESECVGNQQGSILDCDDAGGYCIFESSCDDIDGSELSTYTFSCSGTKICCDSDPASQTCNDIGGEICSSNEQCSVSNIETLDTYDCCTGNCNEVTSESECASYGGTCRDSCSGSEQEDSYDCDYIGEVCCVSGTAITTDEDKSYWWIWVLLLLIILVVVGIIFRDKLRPIWFRIKT